MKQINCFIAFNDASYAQKTVENLSKSELVNKIYLLTDKNNETTLPGCEIIQTDSFSSSLTIQKIAEKSDTQFSLLLYKTHNAQIRSVCIGTFLQHCQ